MRLQSSCSNCWCATRFGEITIRIYPSFVRFLRIMCKRGIYNCENQIGRDPASGQLLNCDRPNRVVSFSSWKLIKYRDDELSKGFDIYFPRKTESRFHCLSSCLPSSFSRRANSLCECFKCRRNTRNLELSDSCQLTLSENLQGMTGARQPRVPSLVHLLCQT